MSSRYSATINPMVTGLYQIMVKRDGYWYSRTDILMENWYAIGTESHAEEKARRILRRLEAKAVRKSKTITLDDASSDY